MRNIAQQVQEVDTSEGTGRCHPRYHTHRGCWCWQAGGNRTSSWRFWCELLQSAGDSSISRPAILHCILVAGLLQTRWKSPVLQEILQAYPATSAALFVRSAAPGAKLSAGSFSLISVGRLLVGGYTACGSGQRLASSVLLCWWHLSGWRINVSCEISLEAFDKSENMQDNRTCQ